MKLDMHKLIRIALFIALISAVQQFRVQWATGPLVNAILILTTMYVGLAGGMLVSLISPILALLQGIMPLAAMLPFIIAGNIVLCVVYNLARRFVPVVLLGPLLKAAVIVLGTALLAGLPFGISCTLGLNQLITAVAGTSLAFWVAHCLPFNRLHSRRHHL